MSPRIPRQIAAFVPATVTVALLFLAGPAPASSASILFYFGISGHSHVSSIWPVIEALGNRGHQITLLTSIPPRSTHPSVSVVHVPEMFDAFKGRWDIDADLLTDRFNGRRISGDDVLPMGLATCTSVFTAPSSQKFVYNSSFDLVIMDTGLNECALGLAALHYKCPFMVYNALSAPPGSHDDYGIPVESSWVPDMEYARPVRTFADRLLTTWQGIKWARIKSSNYYPKLAQIFVDHLKLEETPDFVELQKRTSLVLMNGHYAHGYAMSLPPLFVSIAGVGMQDQRKELPKPLAEFIASGHDGFIYVSFGTQVQIQKSKPELRAKFFNVFASFPLLKFVWKWEGEVPTTDVPSNIYFSKWMPQQDLLAHPSCKGYIGHGGMNGVNEGVHYGVPMIVFPIMGDQDFNAIALAAKELAFVMEIADFTEDELQEKLELILDDEALKGRVKKASAVFKDRPMKPVDTAVWWIEYVLRHGDTSFLMPAAVHQTWYQRRLIDVWFFAYTVLVASLCLLVYCGSKLYSSLCLRTSKLTPHDEHPVLDRDINLNKVKRN